MGLNIEPDIDSDISLSAVTNVFRILRDTTMGCITRVSNNSIVSQLKVINTGHDSSYINRSGLN